MKAEITLDDTTVAKLDRVAKAAHISFEQAIARVFDRGLLTIPEDAILRTVESESPGSRQHDAKQILEEQDIARYRHVR